MTALRDRKFLTSAEVKKMLGYSTSNPAEFLQMIRRERLPFIRINARRFIFDEAQLTAWIERRTFGRTA